MTDLLQEFGLKPATTQEAPQASPQGPQPAAPEAAPQATPQATPEAAPGGQGTSFLGQAAAVAKDIGVGLTELPTAIGHGVIRAANEMSNTAFDLAKTADRYLPLGQVVIDKHGVRWQPGTPAQNDLQVPNIIPEPTTVTGRIEEGTAQFVTSYVMGGKLLKAFGIGPAVGTAGRLVETTAKSAFAGAAGFDPSENRLSNLIQDVPVLANPITAFLAASPDDSRAAGRLKNALETTALNVPLEALFYAVKGLKAKRIGDLEEAAVNAKASERALLAWRETSAKSAGESLDAGGSGKPAPKLDTDALEMTQQTGLHGLPGEPTTTPLKATEVTPPKSDFEPIKGPGGAKFDGQNLIDTFALASGNGSNVDTFAGSIVGKNMARVSNENDAKTFFNVLGTIEADAFAKAKGRPRTLVEMQNAAEDSFQKLADYTGTDVGELRTRMAADVKNLNALTRRVAGYRMGVEVYSKRSAELARAIIKGDASEFGGDVKALNAEFLKTAQTLMSIAPLSEGVKSGLGRNLSLLRAEIGPGSNAVGKLPGIAEDAAKGNSALQGDMARALEGHDYFIKRLALKLQLADNPKLAKKIVDDAFGPGLFDVHNEYWINALLSGPKTHVVNMTTSALKSALVMPTEQFLSGVLTANPTMMRMAADQYAGMFLSMKDAIKLAGTALKNGLPVLDPTHMGLSNSRHAITAETFGLDTSTPLGLLTEGLGNVLRVPSRLLTTEDEFLKQINYRGRLYAQAVREARAMKVQHNMSDDEVAKYVSDYMERGYDANGRGINQEALAYSQDATFTNTLDVASSGNKSIGQAINEMANSHPGLRLVLPFTRVPTNILRDAWDHTPGINLMRRQYRAELDAGGQRRAMALAKMATGSGLWTAAIMMALNGDITGNLSSDPATRKMEMQAGKVPNAFRFYDENGKPYYIEYGRLDPYATFFSTAATIAEGGGHMNDWQMEDIAGSLVVGLAKNIESKTYLQGLINWMSALADPDRRGVALLRQQMASYVPAVTNTFKGADYLSDPHNIAQAMLARTPGYPGVDPQYNLVGERVQSPPAFGPDWLSPMMLGPAGSQDPVLGELARLRQLNKGGISLPSKSRGGIDLTQINLGDKTAYARFQELQGEAKIGGHTLRDRLGALFNSEYYKKRLTDGSADYDGSRTKQVQAILGEYRKAAEAGLRRESPEYNAKWIANERNKIQALRFQGTILKP